MLCFLLLTQILEEKYGGLPPMGSPGRFLCIVTTKVNKKSLRDAGVISKCVFLTK
jgi:hypothetical protein